MDASTEFPLLHSNLLSYYPSVQSVPIRVQKNPAIEDKAKPRFMTDLASLNAEHLRQICFLIKTLPHTEIPNYQL